MSGMIIGYLFVLLFTSMMLIKGGILGYIKWYDEWKYRPEGKWVSGFILGALVHPLFGLAWVLGNSPKMNDPAGPEWKLATQRGIFLGACLTFSSGLYGDPNIWYIAAGAMLPWLFRLSIWQTDGKTWVYGEAYLGAALGLAYISG